MDRNELDQMIDDALAPDVPALHDWIETGMVSSEGYGGELTLSDDPPPWEIDGERTLAWACRKVAEAERERAVAKAEADRLRAVAAEYEARVAAKTERTLDYFLGRIRHYHDRVLAESPRRLTLEVPGFQVKRRAGAVSTEVTDEDELRAWLEDRDDVADFLDYPAPKVKRTPLKQRFAGKVGAEPGHYPAMDDTTGEKVPGVSLVRGVPSETVTVIKPTEGD